MRTVNSDDEIMSMSNRNNSKNDENYEFKLKKKNKEVSNARAFFLLRSGSNWKKRLENFNYYYITPSNVIITKNC